jgi:hypothetical protein
MARANMAANSTRKAVSRAVAPPPLPEAEAPEAAPPPDANVSTSPPTIAVAGRVAGVVFPLSLPLVELEG